MITQLSLGCMSGSSEPYMACEVLPCRLLLAYTLLGGDMRHQVRVLFHMVADIL